MQTVLQQSSSSNLVHKKKSNINHLKIQFTWQFTVRYCAMLLMTDVMLMRMYYLVIHALYVYIQLTGYTLTHTE
jgi:hypothetical protein